MIVVIYVKDGYWIGADSYRSAGEKHGANVCKIHETPLGLLVKSGRSQGTTELGQEYSTDKEVEDLLRLSESVKDFKSKLRMQFKQDIEKELVFLTDDQYITPENLEQMKMRHPIPQGIIPLLIRSVTMFDTKTPDANGEILLVKPQSDLIPPLRYYKYCAYSIFDWYPVESFPPPQLPAPHLPFSYASSIRQLSYVVSYPKSDDWVRHHPQLAIKEMLDQGHKEEPDSIGPPYAIVHIVLRHSKLPKVKWISKGVCPGWTESIGTEGTLLQLRDELRK